MKVKYKQSFPGMFLELTWQPGEIKELKDDIALKVLENSDFEKVETIVSSNKTSYKKKIKEEE